jgi:thioredoxin-like negative regulator of GroEL
MEPVSLIVTALAAGAASGAVKGLTESASAGAKKAWQALRDAVAARFADAPTAQVVLTEHASDPDTYDKAMAKQLQLTGADTDPRIVALAQELMTLIDPAGTNAGKYTIDLRGAQGVQVGDHNTQTNTFN